MSQELTADVYDIDSFCKSHRISRALFYLLNKDGRGPKVMKVGRRTLITKESAASWRQRMEQQTARPAAA